MTDNDLYRNNNKWTTFYHTQQNEFGQEKTVVLGEFRFQQVNSEFKALNSLKISISWLLE